MLLSKIHRGALQGECRRLHFAEFGTGADAPGGGWTAEPGNFVPSAPPRGAAQAVVPAPVNVKVLEQEAYARGRQAGIEEAQERFGRSADALARGLEEISRLRESLLHNSSQDMLRLVMTIARQVLQAETTVRRDLVLKTIDRALQAAVQADHHHILVSPEDLEIVQENKPLFLAGISGLKNLTIQADPDIAPGGCRLESEIGAVDATIDGQLEEIRRTLLAAVEEG